MRNNGTITGTMNIKPDDITGGETVITKALEIIKSLAEIEELVKSRTDTMMPIGWAKELETIANSLKSNTRYEDINALSRLGEWMMRTSNNLRSMKIASPKGTEKLNIAMQKKALFFLFLLNIFKITCV